MVAWTKKNALGVGVVSLIVATAGLVALVKLLRAGSSLGDMSLALIPVVLVVGLATAASMFGLTAAGISLLGARSDGGSPTSGPPH